MNRSFIGFLLPGEEEGKKSRVCTRKGEGQMYCKHDFNNIVLHIPHRVSSLQKQEFCKFEFLLLAPKSIIALSLLPKRSKIMTSKIISGNKLSPFKVILGIPTAY